MPLQHTVSLKQQLFRHHFTIKIIIRRHARLAYSCEATCRNFGAFVEFIYLFCLHFILTSFTLLRDDIH